MPVRIVTTDATGPVHADPVVELLYTRNCAHLDATRALLGACIAELGLHINVVEREGAYLSPTILVDGVDVMGSPPSDTAACRLDLPTRQQILEALTR